MTQYITIKNNIVQDVQDASWMNHSQASSSLSDVEWWSSLTKDAEGQYIIEDDGSYSVRECTDEDVHARLNQLSDYVSNKIEGITYNIKYYVAKRNAEEILDIDGNSYDPEQYVQSHFVGQDDTRDARVLADEWTQIRTERDRLLTSTDWTQSSDTALTSAKVTQWGTYRTSLRTLPVDQSSKTKYSLITWPTKP